jgi:hypothetical protein
MIGEIFIWLFFLVGLAAFVGFALSFPLLALGFAVLVYVVGERGL